MYIVQTAAANMPSSCWGIYRRVAVLEIDGNVSEIKMISSRARGVRRVVKTWEKLNVGKTGRCAYNRALAEAAELVARLSAEVAP